jgi:hypothetical protein
MALPGIVGFAFPKTVLLNAVVRPSKMLQPQRVLLQKPAWHRREVVGALD